MPVIEPEYPSRSPPHLAVSGCRGWELRTQRLEVIIRSAHPSTECAIYVVAAIAAVVGFVMTFRDYSF
jgi:hypothetical protein